MGSDWAVSSQGVADWVIGMIGMQVPDYHSTAYLSLICLINYKYIIDLIIIMEL